MKRKVKYGAEAVLLIVFWLIFRAMPLDVASWVGGRIARTIGPLTRAHQTAKYNMERVLSDYTHERRAKLLAEMWDNLGRVAGEYPHLMRPLMKERIHIEGAEYLDQVKGEAALYVSGHFANWEIAPMAAALCGLPLALIYRAPNSKVADWFIRQIRKYYNPALYNKGREGAAYLIKAFKRKESVGLLLDQKMNDGEAVPFMGFSAMTATAGITLALRAGAPILPARVVRLKGVHFHVTVCPPLYYSKETDSRVAMLELHTLFEAWVREHPAQWFWVHNRWDWKKINA